jgi:nicotine blue oxidoreductase
VSVAGLLLAAGGGRRFGGPKALVVHDGELLVERGSRLLRVAGCQPVVVVLGAAAEEVRSRADLGDAEVVVNDGWEEGIGSSLRAGLGHLEGRPEVGAVVVHLCDQPQVAPDAVRRLMDRWRGGAHAAVASYEGEPRNPVLLDRALFAEVSALALGDVGARAYLRRHPEVTELVPCDDVASAVDVDRPSDLEGLRPSPPER